MKARTARLVYCVGLFVVTACAALPEILPQPVATAPTAQPLTTEARLAHAIRNRIERQQVYGVNHPGMIEAMATETALRDLAFADDVSQTRRELISALSNELSDALSARTSASALYGSQHPRLLKADAVVTGLTAAINTEVHRNRG